MEKRLAPLVLLAIILALPAPAATQATLQKPAYIEEYPSSPSIIDLQGVWIDDNQTSLLLTIQLGAAPPPIQGNSPTSSISYSRYAGLCLDLDNNITSGYTWTPALPRASAASTLQAGVVLTEADALPTLMGIDAIVYIEFDHDYATGWTSVWAGADIYNPDGTWAASATLQATPVPAAQPTLALNLTELAQQYQQATGIHLTITTFKAALCEAFNDEMFEDSLANPTLANVTISSATITVDGDPSDWDPAATLLTQDDPDTLDFTPINDANFTAIYVATDNVSLFFRLDLEAPAIQYADPADNLAEVVRYFYVGLDINNDGVVDYDLEMHPDGIFINGQWFAAGGPVYNVSWYGTSTPEFAVNLSSIGLGGWTAGNNLSITIYGLELETYEDYSWDYQAYYTPYLTYTIGLGGEPGSGVLVYPGLSGLFTIIFEDAEFGINLPLATNLYLGNFTSDPMGVDGLSPRGLVPFTSFYYFSVSDPAAVAWPINITITYSDATLEALGLNESRLKALYYDKNAGAYLELPSYTVNTTSNTVTITLTQDVYMAGDPVVVLSAPPLVVGGKLVGPSKPSLLLVAGVVLLAASAALAGYGWWKRRA